MILSTMLTRFDRHWEHDQESFEEYIKYLYNAKTLAGRDYREVKHQVDKYMHALEQYHNSALRRVSRPNIKYTGSAVKDDALTEYTRKRYCKWLNYTDLDLSLIDCKSATRPLTELELKRLERIRKNVEKQKEQFRRRS